MNVKRFASILVCSMMIVAVFSMYMIGSLVFATGEMSLKLSKIEDVKGWLDGELVNLGGVTTINIELCDDIYIGYGGGGAEDGVYVMNPKQDYIFNFTDPRFKGKTININGNGREITNCRRDLLFLHASDCVVNLNDVRIRSRHSVFRQSSCIYLNAPSEGQKSVLNMNGSSSIENFCSFGAGAIFAESSVSINMNGNSIIRGCGVERCEWDAICVENENNGMREDGGAICAQKEAMVNMNGNSSIIGCGSGGNGGAIFIEEGTVNMNDQSKIGSCRASQGGGAIYAKSGLVNVNENSEIVGCEAANCGGWAIYIESGAANLNGNCRIVGCELSCAEAILVENGTVMMNANSSVSECRTNHNGAICVFDGLVEMNGNSRISKCKGAEAGAIYVRSGVVNMNENSSISECEAEYGGAIDALKATVNMNANSKISECEAGEGGAIDVFNGTVTMNANSSIVRCRAEGGGAIYSGGCATVILKGGRIEDCCGFSRFVSAVNFDNSYGSCANNVLKIAKVVAKTFSISFSDAQGSRPVFRGYEGIFPEGCAKIEDISPYKVVFKVDGVISKSLDSLETACVGDDVYIPRFSGYDLVDLRCGGSKIIANDGKFTIDDNISKSVNADNVIVLTANYKKAA